MENEIRKDIPGYEVYKIISKCSNCIKGNTHSTIKYK